METQSCAGSCCPREGTAQHKTYGTEEIYLGLMNLELQLPHLVMLYSEQQQCPESMETLVDQ